MASREARRDLVVGGLWLLTLPFGWVLNLGHRLEVVRRLRENQRPWFVGFSPYARTFLRGTKAALAIAVYLSPAAFLAAIELRCGRGFSLSPQWILASIAFALGVFTLPGGMTYYAALGDVSYLYRPDKAFARAVEGGRRFIKAWIIGLTAIALSSLGLLALGVGFLFTSVWAWQVVGYAFSRALVLQAGVPSDRA